MSAAEAMAAELELRPKGGVMVEEYCAFADCEKAAFADGLCVGHFRQKERHGRVTGPVSDGNPGVCAREAAFDYVLCKRCAKKRRNAKRNDGRAA